MHATWHPQGCNSSHLFVTCLLHLKNDHAKHNESPNVICYPLCGCIIDKLLVDEVHKKIRQQIQGQRLQQKHVHQLQHKMFCYEKGHGCQQVHSAAHNDEKATHC